MSKKLLLIVNPKAGKGNIKKKLPRIIKNFSDEGYFIETCYTKLDYKPEEIVNEYKNERLDLIVCCGGDRNIK